MPSETATEYEVHNYFVHRAEAPDRLAQLMHKALDAKYRAGIRASQQAQCVADLEEFWSDALAKGDIPGPYWALMTHPLTSEALLVRAFCHTDALSHFIAHGSRPAAGASARARRNSGGLRSWPVARPSKTDAL